MPVRIRARLTTVNGMAALVGVGVGAVIGNLVQVLTAYSNLRRPADRRPRHLRLLHPGRHARWTGAAGEGGGGMRLPGYPHPNACTNTRVLGQRHARLDGGHPGPQAVDERVSTPARPTFWMSIITSSSECGSSDTTAARQPSRPRASSTSPDGTAQTRHRSWVRIKSGWRRRPVHRIGRRFARHRGGRIILWQPKPS